MTTTTKPSEQSEHEFNSVNQWLLSLPEGECKHVNSLGKWELAEKVWAAARATKEKPNV